MELVGGSSTSLDGAVASNTQLTDRLDRAVTALGQSRRLSGLHGAGGGLGVERVVLAGAASLLAVRAVHLEHVGVLADEIAGQAGAPGPAALDTHRDDIACDRSHSSNWW